jgi:branched-subunit amino acid aminotransferase/4-amino-4-deoxychorismate lyase
MSDPVLEYRPETGGLVPCDEPGGSLLVADSWLVADGRVRALDLHFARFAGSASPYLTVPGREGFFAAVRGALAAAGRGELFPRIELRFGSAAPDQGPRLYLRLRPAPPRRRLARLCVHDGPDPRRRPRVKGPDLEALGRVRARAARAGADEALLLGPGGEILEGAYSSLLWWRDGALHLPPEDAAVLPGVTRELVLRLAIGARVPVVRERGGLARLDGAEIWLTSALHGICAVHDRIAPGVHAAQPRRVEEWRERLEAADTPRFKEIVRFPGT